MYKKIEIILERILKLVDEIPKQPQWHEVGSEESDGQSSEKVKGKLFRSNVINEQLYDN